ncbi:hypothetical protein B7Y94_02660 [Candidatus Saccharibacteria bacterium 32-49-12]|nr:MAG: hypothetical protein B7Y94_02660 [Candidatus Saccharibacteria bacterium 32-49-12]
MASKNQKNRTYARNRSKSSEFFSRKGNERLYEKESAFFLKLVVFIILSALWIRLENPISAGPMIIQAIPVGLIVALLLVFKIERYQFNRKIWYATLILMGILTSFTSVGIIV